MLIRFVKAHGAGNDFVLLDGRSLPELAWPALARAVSDRHRGVGADGLLLLQPDPEADFRYRMFNPDGTEDFCGNGFRCAVRYAAENGWVPGPEMRVATLAGPRPAWLEPDGRITVGLGRPSFAARDVPVATELPELVEHPLETPAGELRVTSLTTGTAHTVILCDAPVEEELFRAVSPWLETHPLFPERTTVLWAWPAGRDRFEVRIWERGAGETLACGSGAAAVAAVAHRLDRGRFPAAVRSGGGILEVARGPGGALRLTGPAVLVFRGEFPWSAAG